LPADNHQRKLVAMPEQRPRIFVDREAWEAEQAFQRMMAHFRSMSPEELLQYDVERGIRHPDGTPVLPEGEPHNVFAREVFRLLESPTDAPEHPTDSPRTTRDTASPERARLRESSAPHDPDLTTFEAILAAAMSLRTADRRRLGEALLASLEPTTSG
jgi:hypothetical protein